MTSELDQSAQLCRETWSFWKPWLQNFYRCCESASTFMSWQEKLPKEWVCCRFLCRFCNGSSVTKSAALLRFLSISLHLCLHTSSAKSLWQQSQWICIATLWEYWRCYQPSTQKCKFRVSSVLRECVCLSMRVFVCACMRVYEEERWSELSMQISYCSCVCEWVN